jgi:hypothetical protein
MSLIAALVLLAVGTPMMGQSGVLMMSISDSLYYIDLKTAEYREINVELGKSGELLPGSADSAGATIGKTSFGLSRWLWLRDSTVYVPVITRKANAANLEHMVYAVNKTQIVSGTVTLGKPLYPAPSGFFPVQYRGFTLVPFRSSGKPFDWASDSLVDCLLTRGAEVVDTIYRVKVRKRLNDGDIVPDYSWLILDTNLLNNRIELYRTQRGEPKPSRLLNDTVVIFDRNVGGLVVAENGIAIDTIRIPCDQLIVVKEHHKPWTMDAAVSNVYNGRVAASVYVVERSTCRHDNRAQQNAYQFFAIIDITQRCNQRYLAAPLFGHYSMILLP